MPHKDRDQRLEYLRRWKETGRPAPAPEAQPDPGLPPRGAVVFSEDGERVQCHACGRWFRCLTGHLKAHGLDAGAYKETYDLKRTASLWPPVLQARQREAALERGQGEVGRAHLPETAGRPKGLAARLSSRVEASRQRRGVHTRGGQKTNQPP